MYGSLIVRLFPFLNDISIYTYTLISESQGSYKLDLEEDFSCLIYIVTIISIWYVQR